MIYVVASTPWLILFDGILFLMHNTRVRRNPSGFLEVAVSKARNPPCSCAHLAYSRFRYSTKTFRELAQSV